MLLYILYILLYYIYVYIYIYIYILLKTEIGSRHTECSICKKQEHNTYIIYGDVMQTIQCAYPPHHLMALWRHGSYGWPVVELT